MRTPSLRARRRGLLRRRPPIVAIADLVETDIHDVGIKIAVGGDREAQILLDVAERDIGLPRRDGDRNAPKPGGDGFRSLAAESTAVSGHDTVFAFGRVRSRYAVGRGVVVAIAGTTDQPVAWRQKREKNDSECKLGAGRRDAISSSAAPDLE